MGGKVISKVVELGWDGVGGCMSMDMGKYWLKGQGLPNVENPLVEGTGGVIFKGECCRVGGEGTYGIEVVRVREGKEKYV